MSAEEKADEHDGAAVHGDILESILSHVPLIDLASSSCVSRGWERAVSSSLSHYNALKPWLLLFSHPNSRPSSAATTAYDPRSAVWMDIKHRPPITPAAPLRSSHSTLLYTLTPSKFSFSIDPLHLTWHHVDPPLTWRTDPIVALVAHRAIVIAGTSDFLDDAPAVEIYDFKSKAWDPCDELPSIFAEYATVTWFSIAVDGDKLHVMHKDSAAIYSFDPMEKSWAGPYDLKPDPDVFSSIIGFAGGEMVVVGLLGSPEDVGSVKIWEVLVQFSEWREIGEMPKSLVEKLQGESAEMASIGMSSAGDFIFLYHGSDPVEVTQCELVGDSGCRWGVVPNTVVDDRTRLRRLVFTSSNVGIGDLQRALRSESPRITVNSRIPTFWIRSFLFRGSGSNFKYMFTFFSFLLGCIMFKYFFHQNTVLVPMIECSTAKFFPN